MQKLFFKKWLEDTDMRNIEEPMNDDPRKLQGGSGGTGGAFPTYTIDVAKYQNKKMLKGKKNKK